MKPRLMICIVSTRFKTSIAVIKRQKLPKMTCPLSTMSTTTTTPTLGWKKSIERIVVAAHRLTALVLILIKNKLLLEFRNLSR